MKRLFTGAVLAVACLTISACATIGAGSPASADDAAIRLERAVAAVAVTLTITVDDPASTLDQEKLGAHALKAMLVLDEGRSLFDARTGDPAALATRATDGLAAGLPADAPPKVSAALLAARLALAIYSSGIALTGEPTSPPAELVAARAATDRAVDELLRHLSAAR